MDKKYQILLEHALYSELKYVLGIPENEMIKLITENV